MVSSNFLTLLRRSLGTNRRVPSTKVPGLIDMYRLRNSTPTTSAAMYPAPVNNSGTEASCW